MARHRSSAVSTTGSSPWRARAGTVSSRFWRTATTRASAPRHCAGLARAYLDQCRRLRECGADCIEVRYEELLADPDAVAAVLGRFVGGKDEARIQRAAALVRPPV